MAPLSYVNLFDEVGRLVLEQDQATVAWLRHAVKQKQAQALKLQACRNPGDSGQQGHSWVPEEVSEVKLGKEA